MAGADITNVKAIMSASGNWRIEENGELIVKKVTAETGEFKKGVTIYDEDTAAPYCTKIKGGNSIVLPGKCDDAAPVDESEENLVE